MSSRPERRRISGKRSQGRARSAIHAGKEFPGRGLALAAEATGDADQAFALLADARARSNRLADPYVWLDGYILDAQSELDRRYGHPNTRIWVETLRNLASRTGMREFTLRSLLHRPALGNAGDSAAAVMLASEIKQ